METFPKFLRHHQDEAYKPALSHEVEQRIQDKTLISLPGNKNFSLLIPLLCYRLCFTLTYIKITVLKGVEASR